MKPKLIIVIAVWGSLHAVPAHAQSYWKGWLDLGGAFAQPIDGSYKTSKQTPLFGERATSEVVYSNFPGGAFNISGGYMFASVIGVGVAVTRCVLEDIEANGVRVNVTVPSARVANQFRSDSQEPFAPDYRRTELTLNVQAMLVVTPGAKKVRVRLYGGPTFFRVTQETLDRVTYIIVANAPIVATRLDDFSEKSGTGWGFHAGGDVAYFFMPSVGIGGYVQMTKGTTPLTDFSGSPAVPAGTVQLGASLHVRF